LTEAFTYAKYYFRKETPRFFTTLSDFGYFFHYAGKSERWHGILEMFLEKISLPQIQWQW
jgi:hypothetical protein